MHILNSQPTLAGCWSYIVRACVRAPDTGYNCEELDQGLQTCTFFLLPSTSGAIFALARIHRELKHTAITLQTTGFPYLTRNSFMFRKWSWTPLENSAVAWHQMVVLDFDVNHMHVLWYKTNRECSQNFINLFF